MGALARKTTALSRRKPIETVAVTVGALFGVPIAVLSATAASAESTASAPELAVTPARGLAGVYCTSATNCWSVGFADSQAGAVLNQILHWTGKHWSRVTAPSPGGTKSGHSSQLASVRCTSPQNCWAVGTFAKGLAEATEALHWNGRQWSQVKTPNPSGLAEGDFSELNDVACTSASSCWAAGQYGHKSNVSDVILNLTLHWNGRQWSHVKTPNPSGTSNGTESELDAVRCPSPRDCWAIGTTGSQTASIFLNEALHWNGQKWSDAAVPSQGPVLRGDYNTLNGLSCTSAKDCWAVGAYGGLGVDGFQLNQALHWNGTSWKLVKTPNPDGTGTDAVNFLTGVTCSSAANCWAVGYFGSAAQAKPVLGEALHWKGTKWVTVNTPAAGASSSGDSVRLSSVRCVVAKDCWAVGTTRISPGSDQNQILHWNSTKWSAS